jgi:Capsular polysaccharide biosynthesis protein
MENNNYEDEISLKELIMTLIKHKWLILITTVIVLSLGFVYAYIISDEVYEASLVGVISVSETATTKYGEYTFPSTNKMDYLNVILSEEVLSKVINNLKLNMTTHGLRSNIKLITEKDSSTFEINATAKSSEEATQLVTEVSDVFLKEINYSYKEKAIDVFLRSYFVSINSNQETLEQQQKTLEALKQQLASISPTITLKKLVTSDPVLAAEIAREKGVPIESLSKEMMMEEIINPDYESLSAEAVSSETTIESIKIALAKNEKFYQELKDEEAAMHNYYVNGESEALKTGSLEFMLSKISMNTMPSFSSDPIAPRKMMILAISGVLGLMMGVFFAFFKGYWENN